MNTEDPQMITNWLREYGLDDYDTLNAEEAVDMAETLYRDMKKATLQQVLDLVQKLPKRAEPKSTNENEYGWWVSIDDLITQLTALQREEIHETK